MSVGLQIRVCNGNKNDFSYFSTQTYVVGTQKNCLNETFEHPKHLLKLMGKCSYLEL